MLYLKDVTKTLTLVSLIGISIVAAVAILGQEMNSLPPKILVAPIFPDLARRAGKSGAVNCRVLINERGKIDKILEMSGNSLLQDAVKSVLSEWTYPPYQKREEKLNFQFHLLDRSDPQGFTVRIILPNEVHVYDYKHPPRLAQ